MPRGARSSAGAGRETVDGNASAGASDMYVENAWYAAGWADDLADQPVARRILDKPVVVFRTEGGAAAAFDDCCPHRMVPLSLGRIEGEGLRCGYHGLKFATDGSCVLIPGQDEIPRGFDVKAYPVVERWRMVWIWMGEPGQADEREIPNLPWLDDAGWRAPGGVIRYGCDYRLLIDNLLDLSHTTFVHQSTIGTDDVATTPVTSERIGDTVLVTRVMNDTQPSKLYMRLGGFTGRVDRWQRIEYRTPSIVVIDAGAVPAGSNDPSRGIDTRVINVLTPETGASVLHYWAFARDFSLDDPSVDDFLGGAIKTTFEEDLAFLDAQQARMTERPGQALANANADAGVVLARRLLSERLEA